MFCTQCGALAGDAHKFCESCGHQLGGTSPKRLVTGTTVHDVLGSHGGVSRPLPPPTEIESEQFRVLAAGTKEVKPERFLDVIGYGFKNYAQFDGRATRVEFWKWYLYFIGLPFLVVLVLALMSFFVPPLLAFGPLALILIPIVHIIPTLACAVRRLHDTGRPGYGLLVGFIPIVGNLILLYWLIQPSLKELPGVSSHVSSERAENDLSNLENIAAEAESSGTEIGANGKTLRTLVLASLSCVALMVIAVQVAFMQVSRLVDFIEDSETVIIEYKESKASIYDDIKSRIGDPRLGMGYVEFQARHRELATSSGYLLLGKYDEIDDLWIPFWDTRAQKVKARYLEHSSAWQEALKLRQTNPNSAAGNIEINSTWTSFCVQIDTAKPLSAFRAVGRRLEGTCADD